MKPPLILLAITLASMTQANTGSLFPGDDADTPLVSRSSLVITDRTAGLFAPLPPRAPDVRPSGSQTAQLLDLIAEAEAGRAGYDAVQLGARIRPDRPPTQMTLGDIYTWIAATPGQPHAIGRYQFIPTTLRRVAGIRGFGPDVRFSPDVQDALALVLLNEAGHEAFLTGTLSRRDFMHNLAKIWAGLPLPNGQSYYQGYAGNAASITWSRFEGGVTQIWPSNP